MGKTDLGTVVGSVELPSPIMTASGTAGYGAELAAHVDLASLGAVVVKSLAHFRCDGNAPLRVYQTPSGMINSVGLQGSGVLDWKRDELPKLLATGARVVASIWGRTVDDYRLAAEMMADVSDRVVAVEVNLSCPNTEAGRDLFAHSVEMTEAVMTVSEAVGRPRWAKLSPNVGPGLIDVARAAQNGGAEAVTIGNTFFGLVIDPVSGMAVLGGGGGGVSGPAIRPLALRAVADVRAGCPDLPIVGVGGIASPADVVQFARAGSNAVQIGTASFADPKAVAKVQKGLNKWCVANGYASFSELVNTYPRTGL